SPSSNFLRREKRGGVPEYPELSIECRFMSPIILSCEGMI
ncbi:unnamed protein product, partial [Mycena citricolor]